MGSPTNKDTGDWVPGEKSTSLEEVADGIFGQEHTEGHERWVDYWGHSVDRNRQLLESFEKLILMEFKHSRVLDIGCGTGGLAPLISERGGTYTGLDYHFHIIQFARRDDSTSFVHSCGLDLPFPEDSFDFIFCFDVIEHLTGGKEWQIQLLREVKRVMSPLGMLFLTTPNFWYPYDAHTDLYLPQFLPRLFRDRYIGWRKPGFIKEHQSFDNIRLVSPSFLRKALNKTGFSTVHELPCGLDQDQYSRLHPLLGPIASLGLGWYLHAEFWMILTHEQEKNRQRLKLPANWNYEHIQPSQAPITEFTDSIDFNHGAFNHQLGSGWNLHEEAERGYRWTEKRAVCYLESKACARFLSVKGFSPIPNGVKVWVDGCWIGEKKIIGGAIFEATFLLPFLDSSRRIFEVRLQVEQPVISQDVLDRRELGLMIFSIQLLS